MHHFDLLIFDLDGTLIDARKDIANSVNFALVSLGLKRKSVKTISAYIGWGVDVLISKSLGRDKRYLLKQAMNLYMRRYRASGLKHSRLYPNVRKVLQCFRHKKMAVITNRNNEFGVLGLKKLKIDKYFKLCLGADNIRCRKPSPCPVNTVLRRLKVAKNRAIVVGDMDVDIASGRRAGVATCAVTYGIGSLRAIKKAKPDYLINNIIELKKIII